MNVMTGIDLQTDHVTSTGSDEPDFVVVDVETACSRVSSICQIGIAGFKDGREVFAWETLVDPRDDFSSFNIRIHGIAADHVIGQPTYEDIHPVVDAHLAGRITVAHSYFDKGALAGACRIHGYAPIETNWLDSVRVAKRAWPHLDSHRLNALSRFLGLQHKHHDALSDARAAAMVIVRAIEHTGIELKEWLTPPNTVAGRAPKPVADGPLLGERVALLGASRDGALAQWIASAGGRIVSSVGVTTTMLVVAEDQPFGRWANASIPWRKADALRAAGQQIAIVTEQGLRSSVTGAAP